MAKKRTIPAEPPDLDESETAYSIVDQVALISENQPGKNPAAVALGRLGGLRGGRARAESLTAKRRREIALKAVKARWAKRDGGTK